MVPPDDPARSGEHDPKRGDGPRAAATADTIHAHASDDDDPPLSELAASATPRKKAKTLGDVAAQLPPAPTIPPPPTIAAGARARVKTGLAFEFDLGGDPGPMTLNKLTAGPAVPARGAKPPADDEAPTLAREDAGAAEALAREARAALEAPESLEPPDSEEAQTEERPAPSAASDPERGEAESSGRAGPPRLPMPGMLGKHSAAEFRDVRRPPKPPIPAGIVPAGGVMPPGAVEAKRQPQNTEMLIDVVAAELMEPEPDDEDEVAIVAPASAGSEPVGVAASSSVARDDSDPTPPKRWMIAAAAVLLVGVAVWGLSRGDSQSDTEHAKPTAKASPDEASMVAKVQPPRPAETTPEPAHAQGDGDAAADADPDEAEADVVDAADDVDAEPALETGDTALDDAAAGSGGEAKAGDLVIEPEPEPTPAPAATPAATSSKSSSRKSSKTKSRSKSTSSSPSKPATADASSASAPAPKDIGGDDPKALLAQAKAALKAGNGSKAYTLASKSNKLKYSSDAIEVMTMASCMKKDESRAKSLFRQVPLFRRSGVKSKCKSYGVKVGI